MSIVLDYIASSIMFGILLLTVGRIQININATLYQNMFTVRAQTNAVAFARQLESDFLKMGNKVSGRKLYDCEFHKIAFVGSLTNVTGAIDSVVYEMGTTSEASFSANTNDFPIKRTVNGGTTLVQQWGTVKFRLWYYDSNNVQLSTAGFSDAATCNAVRAIKVFFRVEAPEPVISLSDTTWASVTWEKFIVPRNLNNYYY